MMTRRITSVARRYGLSMPIVETGFFAGLIAIHLLAGLMPPV